MSSSDAHLLEQLWAAMGGPPELIASVSLSGPLRALPSAYDVGALATASVAAALLAVAELSSARTGERARAVRVERAHAATAFRSERYVAARGWSLPSPWDPIAGDYRARDGWIRLHTNYRHHREAALRVLGATEARAEVAGRVAQWAAEDLETAVVAAGGCAARMRSMAEWAAHPQGKAVAEEPPFATLARPGKLDLPPRPRLPLEGVRVLDLTRVIAGPICTRVLAAYGADVLRIDPPGFEELGVLLPETTAGKRRAFLDLREGHDRARLERLIVGAHVLVSGYRSPALDRLGFAVARRRELNPSLVDASLDAYGWTGPWAERRGFDSLVQMSTGIAERGRVAMGMVAPSPLPAQALDHASGYLLAAVVCRGLVRALRDGKGSQNRLSLARTAKILTDLGDDGDVRAPGLPDDDALLWCEEVPSAFGPIRRVRCPDGVFGIEPCWRIPPGPLGVDQPVWLA